MPVRHDLLGDLALRQEFGLVLPTLSIVVVISLLRESLYGGKQVERRKAGGDGISVRRLISKGCMRGTSGGAASCNGRRCGSRAACGRRSPFTKPVLIDEGVVQILQGEQARILPRVGVREILPVGKPVCPRVKSREPRNEPCCC